MRLFISVICTMMFGALTVNAQTPAQTKSLERLLQAPLFEPALDYMQIPMIEDCEERTLRPPKYHYCRNSSDIYAKALANAKAKNQPLMVIFGFDSCPSCRAMDKVVFNSKSPMTNDHVVRYLSRSAIDDYVIRNDPMAISVVRINGLTKHGLELADQIGATQIAKDRGWHKVWSPFILFINPNTGEKHSESFIIGESTYCDWGAEFATNLEGIGYTKEGNPYRERKRCKA